MRPVAAARLQPARDPTRPHRARRRPPGSNPVRTRPWDAPATARPGARNPPTPHAPAPRAHTLRPASGRRPFRPVPSIRHAALPAGRDAEVAASGWAAALRPRACLPKTGACSSGSMAAYGPPSPIPPTGIRPCLLPSGPSYRLPSVADGRRRRASRNRGYIPHSKCSKGA